ncbi:MAG: cation diffusion facilitator family transporter [Myxococcota bacterium]
MSGDTKHIYQALAVNTAIVVVKGVASVVTGSGSMLAETLHSLADCANQGLLFLGLKRSAQPPDALHPLGYGRNLYFWSFMVALLLFSGGGVFAIYEGVHKILEPEPVERAWLAIGILGFSVLLEGYATISNIRALNQKRGDKPFFRFLRDSKDSDLIVIFGENSADTVGLIIALLAVLAAQLTGDGRYDAVGSLLVGCVLVAITLFLANEVKSLLLGEAADTEISAAIQKAVEEHPDVDALLRLITLQQGPGEVMVAMKVRVRSTMNADQVVVAINELEKRVKELRPEVRWSFVEPDFEA